MSCALHRVREKHNRLERALPTKQSHDALGLSMISQLTAFIIPA
jgi:hypothetical protein